MLLNHLLSFAALLSVAGHTLAAPIPRPNELDVSPLGLAEVEIEREAGGREVEIESTKIVPVEVEAEIADPASKLTVRSHPSRSLAASLLDAQNQLDQLTPQIEQAMQGPLGSIEKSVGGYLTMVDGVVHTLEGQMTSFVGDKNEVLYQNVDGTGQVTDADLAKSFSKFLLTITNMEETVRHVSGYAVTSAQLNIRNDLSSMKKTLGTLLPAVRDNVANIMATAMTMGSNTLA